ncbi:MAG TPA: Arc family DNA-binding protein [Candidatus Scatomorpha merdigallinarum]|nr:Arc family DNA-binding protein [Candidatus Scatomorpha merdigallinarum]
MSVAQKNLTVRIDDTMLDKLHAVADYEGRSANSQVLILIRDCIRKFESEHGEIETSRK